MPIRPVTLAVRVEHVGRYGPDARDTRLTPLVVTPEPRPWLQSQLIQMQECGSRQPAVRSSTSLTGSRLALVNLELRAPFFGLFTGDLNYGAACRSKRSRSLMRDFCGRLGQACTPSAIGSRAGAGARVNVAGFVFEVTARVFDRPDKSWTTSVLLRPGF